MTAPDESPRPVHATRVAPVMRAVGVLVALAALVGIVAGSHARMSAATSEDAIVRVAWSARPERIESCRRVPEEELAKLPAHMRRRVECEGTTARYQLDVARDGAPIGTGVVRGGGMRHDRELYVLREMAVAPGRARVSVRFVRLDSSSTGGDERADTSASASVTAERSAREDAERMRRRAEAIPPVLALDTTLVLGPRTVLLVTYDEALRKLVAVTAPR